MRRIDLSNFQVATSETARDINRRIVLNLIRTHQPISRADLARHSGLQRSTVSVIAEQLIRERWITEGANGHTPRGRRPTFLHLNKERVADIKAAVAQAQLGNVEVLEGQPRETGLPKECCNAIFMSKVYHHFTDPATMNRSLIDSLKPGGRLAVIDFEPAQWHYWLDQPEGTPQDRGGHGMPRSLLATELTQAGFEIEREIPVWRGGPFGRYCVIARKRAN